MALPSKCVPLAIVAAVLLASGCGESPDEVSVTESAADARVLKQDWYGPVELPVGFELISFEHDDPYAWTAELGYAGSREEALQSIFDVFEPLRFHVTDGHRQSPEEYCNSGSLAADGIPCSVILGGTNGDVTIRLARAGGGTRVTVVRSFAHRLKGDPVGPPYPNTEATYQAPHRREGSAAD